MHRLLLQLLECDPRSAKQVRELQDDTRRLLGVITDAPARKTARTPRK